MSKKSNTIIFTLVSTVLNILMTLLIIIALCLLSFVVMNYIFKIHNGQAYQIVWMICFLGGMVLGMFLFVKICGWVIDKFHLADKMDAHIVGKYLPGGKKVQTSNDEEEEPKQKTVMPSSVLKKEDKWVETHEASSYAENMQVFDASNIESAHPEEESDSKNQ